MTDKKSYQGKKVFLTGHTGFKGSWLLYWLKLAGAEVMGYSLAPKPEHKLFDFIAGQSLCRSVFQDILNYPALEKNITDFQPDFIFHLAAQPIVRYSYDHPLETFSVNALGTANVLNAVRKLLKPCVTLIVTTDKVYHNQERSYAYREEDRLGGYDPYSASKACAELIVDSYRNSYFNRANYAEHKKLIVSARAGNVIGGGDWARDRIVPDIIRSLENAKPVVVRNPEAVRPWQHVLEPLHAYILLAEKLASDPASYHNEYNFGPRTSDCLPVEEMVRQAIEVWQSGSYQISNQTNAPHEAGLLTLDIGRAINDLGWRPVYSAREAMVKTISWYKAFDGTNARDLLQKDIGEFLKLYEGAAAGAVTE